ncbi:MAG: fibronectin type III domain-containing protein, partial [Dehalococcoidales bacterium]|nr:fibronectin type III domain-containing protein [Dehalococcoidales bacterium]
MKTKKWLAIILALVSMMALTTYTGVTKSFFIDDEQSTDDALGIVNDWSIFAIDDGFENTNWDQYWNENGITDWSQITAPVYSGTYSSEHASGDTYLTSDDLDASGTTVITVSFWFYIKDLNKGPLNVQLYNGTVYNNWYDLTAYPGVIKNVWTQFSQNITDSQYFISNFRIRFDGSTQTTGSYIDEVSIGIADTIPAIPGGLAATPGDTEVTLDWTDNIEGDLDGYNIYRSTTSGFGYVKINVSPQTTSDYTDSALTNDIAYYYVITAIDLGSNESDYSMEVNATPTDMIPQVPANLAATPGDKQVTLNWDDNSEGDLDGYNIYRSTTSGSGYVKVNVSLQATSDYLDTGLTGGTTYYYVVTAVDLAAHESADSAEASATPTDTIPAIPGGLAATPGDTEVTLDWTDNIEGDLDGYNIYRSTT